MTSSEDGMSTELKRFFAMAKILLPVAIVLGAIAGICGLAILVGGEFPCARRVLGDNYRTRDSIVLIIWSVFIVAMIRKMAEDPDGKVRNEFERYNFQMIEIFSQKLTFSLGIFAIILTGAVASIVLGIVIALSPLWAISNGCVFAAIVM